jgi:HlyD family secretion protein/epimerase transport system membrane fusion protein
VIAMQLILPPKNQQFSYLPAQTEGGEIDSSGLQASIRWPVFAGVGMVMLFVAAFGGWAATAPLAGGAVAQGVLSPDGSRKTIQHLEGGIIADIMVKDGDVVGAGAPLVTLEDTQARAIYDVWLGQYHALRAVCRRGSRQSSLRATT